jgi:four helix bundle protein
LTISSCIVEGYGRRSYKANFLRFLIYSHASCDETIVHLNFLKDTHENLLNEIIVFLEKYDELGAKINKYILYVEKEWR